MKYFFILTLLALLKSPSQNIRVLYLSYDESMYIYSQDENEFKLNFSVVDDYTHKSNSYTFIFQNYENFQKLPLLKIREEVNVDTMKLIHKYDLKQYQPCELHAQLNEYDWIYLIRKEGDKYFSLPLNYYGTSKWKVLKNQF